MTPIELETLQRRSDDPPTNGGAGLWLLPQDGLGFDKEFFESILVPQMGL
jgi:hypothetical protein